MKNIRNSIRQIIKETFESVGNYESVVESYNVRITGFHNLFDLDKFEIDYHDAKFSIIWTLDIEGRSWGLKSIRPMVTSIRGEIHWTVDKEELEPEKIDYIRKESNYENDYSFEGVLEINSLNKVDGHSWIIKDDNFKINENGELYPKELTINFDGLEIEVE
jgi:hypothetical protein